MSEDQTEFRQKFIDDFVDFMNRCNFHYAASRSFSNILCDIAYCYRPSIRYWERLTTALIIEALETYMPTLGTDHPDNVSFLQERIADHLYMRQHDERNALLLATLPAATRPENAEEAADWICEELERIGDEEHLEFAERDGAKCGEAALIHLAVLETGANDNRVLDPHADYAHFLLAQAKASSQSSRGVR
ncbi:hypothetical protein H3V53_34175 [Paraburkholderia bengalensis]|uniref:Uncharacterized protein n=1 Tax=Paraburkholderia bengalensis TaxID=2747562 RepID=A0ABU8J224_9BURK